MLWIPRERELLLRRLGMPLPQPQTVRALIDTGSAVTGFDPSVFQLLDIRPVDQMEILTPSTGQTPHVCDRYIVSISCPLASGSLVYPSMYVISAEFANREEAKGLVGRDFLSRCNFYYHGIDGTFTFAFDP